MNQMTEPTDQRRPTGPPEPTGPDETETVSGPGGESPDPDFGDQPTIPDSEK
jgi:hypothetical protein